MVALDLFLAVVGLLGDDAECFFLLVGVQCMEEALPPMVWKICSVE